MPNAQAVLNLQGHSIINGESKAGAGATFYGVDPATGERLEPVYHCASIEDLKQAAQLADEAFATYRKLSGAERGRFLRHIADGIEAIVPEIVERATAKRRCRKRG
jgi:alpha-ketoglutaric semialdehyde dehydrogenase